MGAERRGERVRKGEVNVALGKGKGKEEKGRGGW